MRPICTLLLSAILACGPLAPPLETNTAANSDTSNTTEPDPSPTTTSSEPTTVTTTTLEPTTTAPTTTEENPFIIKPDDGPVGTIECDVFKQDCDPGQKCTAWADGGGGAWNATKCVDVTGDGAPGEPCTTVGGGVSGIDDCGFGVMCWDVNAENQGTCIALCTGNPGAPICPPKFSCAIPGDGVLNLCLPDCDHFIQDCPGDDLCIPTGDHFFCVLDVSGEMGAINDPCEGVNACDKGLLCIDTHSASADCEQNSQGCCQPFCKFPGSPCPNPDQECLQLFDPMREIPPGYETIGFCGIPE